MAFAKQPGNGAVVFGGGDHDEVGGLDGLAQVGDRAWRAGGFHAGVVER